jgi:isopentenyldiphosphate isomerase
MIEMLDIFDDQGVPTGMSAPRSEVHKKGLWHGTVHIYVYRIVDHETKILVHLRSAHKDLYPNTWDPVLGGHIQAGSTPTQTVLEELAGEIGLSLSPSNLVGGSVIKADKGLDKEFNHIFACPFPEHAVVDFRDHEVQKVRWMGLDEVLEALRISPAEWRPTLAEFSAAHSIATSLIKK